VIVEYIRYQVPNAEEFEAAYQRAVGPLGDSPYCLDYELSKCTEAEGSYILRIIWTSAQDHMEKFRGGEEFRRFFAEIKPFLSNIEEMRHYQPVITKS